MKKKEYRSSPPSKNSHSVPEYEIKVKVKNYDCCIIIYLISLYVTSRLGMMIITMLLETRSGHLPKNSRSLPGYEYKSESHCVILKFQMNQHLQSYKMIRYIEN